MNREWCWRRCKTAIKRRRECAFMGATSVAPNTSFLSLRGVKDSLRQAALALDPATRPFAQALLKNRSRKNTRRRLVADFDRRSQMADDGRTVFRNRRNRRNPGQSQPSANLTNSRYKSGKSNEFGSASSGA
ncbi:hypothetical protein [Caballeronia sp. LjRoot31]|uniref:hypothetical protein n=1 Tax=Caballeronia sp. LjRoot31 TaxID=3342324 RepID=UPI003ECEE39B